MSVKAAADQTYEHLKTALAEGKLPPNVADTAVKLCHRLHEPVRVSVMGLPKSGKSTVVNLLLNKIVLPEGVSLPTSQFIKGEINQTVCTLQDGTVQAIAGHDPHAVAALDPIFVEFHMQLPALGRISVLEVVAPESAKDQQRAMHWAAKRTDIALWCTKAYSSIEQALWGSLPEQVKDHAMMLVTHADLQSQGGNLEQMLEELRFGSQHEFNKIMPLATTDAIASRRDDGTTDKAMMQKSGGLTLISSILRQVDRGLQATIDQADLILHKFKDATPNAENVRTVEKAKTARVITKPADAVEDAVEHDVNNSRPVVAVESDQPVVSEKPAADTEATDAFVLRGKSAVYNPLPPEEKDQAEESPEPVVENKPEVAALRVVSEPVVPKRVKSEPKQPQMGRPVAPVAAVDPEAPRKPRVGFMPKAKTTTAAPYAKPETCAAYMEAISYLSQKGKDLTAKLTSEGEISSDELMNASADNITWLSDYLEDLPVADDPVLEKARTSALDATELVQLMQFESNDNAGIEALSLVIQLKRDLETEVARCKQSAPVKAA